MNHKVNSVQNLYDDAMMLFRNVVTSSNPSSADTIITNIEVGIDMLKTTWQGKDAGVQINKLIRVHNGMVEIRNALKDLATDSSKIASEYRNIQNSSGASLQELAPIGAEDKIKLGEYRDDRDTVNISNEAVNGKLRIDAANNAMDPFIRDVQKYYNSIMDNWLAGPGRDKAGAAFNHFLSGAREYKEALQVVSNEVSNALVSYKVN